MYKSWFNQASQASVKQGHLKLWYLPNGIRLLLTCLGYRFITSDLTKTKTNHRTKQDVHWFCFSLTGCQELERAKEQKMKTITAWSTLTLACTILRNFLDALSALRWPKDSTSTSAMPFCRYWASIPSSKAFRKFS